MARDFHTDDILIELLRFDEVEKAVDELKTVAEKNEATNQGFKEAGRFLIRKGKLRLRQRMKSGAGGVTGNLLRSFSYRIKKRSNKLGVIIGFKRSKSESALGYHAHLVSEGTRQRFNSKGQNRGRVTPNFFWSDTKKSDIDQARLLVMQGIQTSINIIKRRYNA